MKKAIFYRLILLFLPCVAANPIFAQQKDVCLKMGNNYFINCQRTIAFGDQSIVSIQGDDKTGRKVNFDIFSPEGYLDASLKNGEFSGTNAGFYLIKIIENGFLITDTRSNRNVLKILNVENKAQKRTELHVWADFYLPNGDRFLCTPEDSNLPMLQMMSGATFSNNETAIQIN